MELNTLNGVKNACNSFPIQNAWKEGKALAVHGVVYNPADGTLKVWSLPNHAGMDHSSSQRDVTLW